MAIMHERLTTDEIVRLNRRYTFFSWSAQAKVNPTVIDRAEGIYFWDPDGKRYIDFNSQLMSVNIGHGDRRVADAIAEQAHTLAFAAPQFATEVRGRLGKLLAELTPGDLNTFFFTLGGAEANENALRMARMVTGRQKVLARFRSYHGATAGAISVTGDPRRWASEPYGGATGAIAGVLIADYWWMRRTNLQLADLYRANGVYRYVNGWNWRAVVALIVGVAMAIGGSYGGPFPADGILPFLKSPFAFADYSWVVGLIVGFVAYVALTVAFPHRATEVAELEQLEQLEQLEPA